jgi:hypothetical protein
VRTSYEGLTVPSSDYRELLYCLNSMRYWYIHRCLPSATVYESICPAGTTERASHYCSLTTRICVPDP